MRRLLAMKRLYATVQHNFRRVERYSRAVMLRIWIRPVYMQRKVCSRTCQHATYGCD